MGWEILGSIAGGLLGGFGSKKSSGGTETAKKEPWEAARPWLIDNLATGQNLQKYYQQNPFNQQQQQAYNDLFGDLSNFRSQIAPGLFDKANQMMGSNYQRQSYARPGMAGYSQGGGLLNQPTAQATFGMPQGGNYGLLNFAQPQPVQPAQAPAIDSTTMAQMIRDELARIQKAKDDETAYLMNAGGN